MQTFLNPRAAYIAAREAYHSYDGGDAARLQHLGLALELAAQNLDAALASAAERPEHAPVSKVYYLGR